MKKTNTKIYRTVYSTFRGADFSTDPSLVEKYRSPLCTNIIADGGGMPQKRDGWRVLHDFSHGEKHAECGNSGFAECGNTMAGVMRECKNGTAVFGLFAGTFEGEIKRVAHMGTGLYLWDESGASPALLCSGLPERKSRGVMLGGKLWIVTGDGFYVYDGSTACRVEECGDVYVPTVTITREPTGGGIAYEAVNMLTPWRREGFQTDGAAVTFLLSGSIDAGTAVKCWVWGTETSPASVDYAAGTVTFASPPPAPFAGSADGLYIEYAHTVTGYADYINHCSICTTYGVGTNDRLVVAGNRYFPHVDWVSGIGDPTYFPDLGYSTVGSEATAIVGYLRIGSQLGIVKEDDGHDSTVYLRSAAMADDGSVSFALQQAIAGVGAVSEGSFASLMDDPLFLCRTGIVAIASNTVTSEKITQGRSFFVNSRLSAEPGLTDAEGCVWKGLYLLALPNGHVYGLDARQDKCYKSESLSEFVYECFYWENVPAAVWLVWKNGTEEDLYFGTADGRICKMNSDLATMDRYADDGEAIEAVWATKYDDDGTPAVEKTMLRRGCCVTIKPYGRSSGEVYFRTDRTGGTERCAAGGTMDILGFGDIDFERFAFPTDDSPQEIFLNRRVKRYKRLQILVRNNVVNEGFGVFEITKHFVIGEYGK